MEWPFYFKLIWPERHRKLSLRCSLWSSVSWHHLRGKAWWAPSLACATAWTQESLLASESSLHRPSMSLLTFDRDGKRKLISPYALRKHKQFSKLSGFRFPNTSLSPTSSKGEVGRGLFHMQTRRRRPRWRSSVGGQGSCWPNAVALCAWERKWRICGALWEVSAHALTGTLDKLNASLTTTIRVSTFKRNQHPSEEVQRNESLFSCSSFHLKLFPL